MALSFPSQSKFFYDTRWSKEKDSFFMTSIIKEFRSNVTEKDEKIPIATLRRARRAIYERFEQHDSWDEICHRFEILRKRYKTFNSLIRQPGVFWDELANVVHASDDVWRRLCEINEFVKAYYYIGENCFDDLVLIFGNEDMNEFSWKELNRSQNIEHIQEVTPEIVSTNARRRLFNQRTPSNLSLPPINFPPRKPDFDLLCAGGRNEEHAQSFSKSSVERVDYDGEHVLHASSSSSSSKTWHS